MNRIVAALVFEGLLAWIAVDRVSAGDEPPVASPPILSGPIVEPALPPSPAQTVPPARTALPDATPFPDRGPLLVLPGMNTPRPGSRVPRNIGPSSPGNRPTVTLSAPTAEDTPSLGNTDSPAPAPYRGPRAGFGPLQGNTSRDSVFSETAPPRAHDSAPMGHEDEGEDAPRGPNPSRKPLVERKPEAPRRAPGLFRRMFPTAVTTRNRSDRNDPVTVEPRTDPAADAAVKRRIERLIGDNLGDRLRTYEVRVVGKEVMIKAKATRFWQKRSVRGALDSLPGLNSYKLSVEMID